MIMPKKILWTGIMQFWQHRPIVLTLNWRLFIQCLKKIQSNSFSPNLSNGHVECIFHNSAKSILTKDEFFSLSVGIYLKIEIVSKNSSAQTVLMNMWIEVLTNRWQFFFQSRKVFFQNPLFFSSKFFFRQVVCNIFNPIEFFPTKNRKSFDHGSIRVTEKNAFNKVFFYQTFLWTCRLWLWQPRRENSLDKAQNVSLDVRKRKNFFSN